LRKPVKGQQKTGELIGVGKLSRREKEGRPSNVKESRKWGQGEREVRRNQSDASKKLGLVR